MVLDDGGGKSGKLTEEDTDDRQEEEEEVYKLWREEDGSCAEENKVGRRRRWCCCWCSCCRWQWHDDFRIAAASAAADLVQPPPAADLKNEHCIQQRKLQVETEEETAKLQTTADRRPTCSERTSNSSRNNKNRAQTSRGMMKSIQSYVVFHFFQEIVVQPKKVRDRLGIVARRLQRQLLFWFQAVRDKRRRLVEESEV